MIIASVPSTANGCWIRTNGSNSIPTETKNSTANASRSGRVSCAARWLSSDSFSTIPAKNAPSAKETSNSSTAPKAMPKARARTERVNSSREPVAALRAIIHGTRRRPTSIIIAINATTLPMVMPISTASEAKPTSSFSSIPATAGRRTSVSTIIRSSTISQPMAICPRWLSMSCRSSSARSSTTVLAVERHRPNTIPTISDQPNTAESAIPSSVATAIWAIAPGMAIDFTAIKSFNEKCSPTPNISRITPSSASSGASLVSATKPGVNGPARTPANRYPTRGEIRSLLAIMPNIKASTRPPTMVVISGVA